MTLTEIIERAENMAAAGLDPRVLQSIDAESHVPSAFAALARKYATEGKANLLARRVKSLTFTNGTASLTDDVMQTFMEYATLTDPDDPLKLYSWVGEWQDFVAAPLLDSRLGYFTTTNAGTVVLVEPDEEYDPDDGLNGDRRLSALCVWEIPEDPTDEVNVSAEVAGDMISILAMSLRGQPEAVEA